MVYRPLTVSSRTRAFLHKAFEQHSQGQATRFFLFLFPFRRLFLSIFLSFLANLADLIVSDVKGR